MDDTSKNINNLYRLSTIQLLIFKKISSPIILFLSVTLYGGGLTVVTVTSYLGHVTSIAVTLP